MRSSDSAYDRRFGQATVELLAALRQAGYAVATPVTGHVLVTGQGRTLDVSPAEWDRLCTWPVEEAVAAVAERLAAPSEEGTE
jgi:hypothetical protein